MPVLYLTGASGALASSIRDRYLAEGWSVAGFDRHAATFTHERYYSYQANALSEPEMSQAFSLAHSELGSPRALIATVGGVKPWMPVADMTVEDFESLLGLNLTSFFISAKLAMQAMQEAGIGSIISIGAEAALEPQARKSGYVAAKAGVIALTRVLAEEGKEWGVSANSIVPNTIRTRANEEWGSPEEMVKWTLPEDIAALAFHLTSDAGHAITGATIRIPNKV